MFHGAAFDFIRNEKLNSPRWAPPGTRRHQRPARSQTVRRRVRRPARQGQDVLLRELFGTASGRDLLPEHGGGADGARAGRRLLAVVDQAARSGDRASRSPAGSSRPRASTSPPRRFRTSTCRCRTCRTTSTKCARPDPINTNEGTLKLDHQFSADAVLRVQLLPSARRRHAAAVAAPATSRGSTATSPGSSTTSTSPHTWTLGSSTINQLRGNYVRQFGAPREQPDDVARRISNSKFTPQGDPTLPRLTVTGYFTGQTSIAGPDAGSNYTGVQGRAEHHQGQALAQDRRRRARTRRSSTTRCSTTTASSPSTAARPATPTPTSCSAFRRR